MSNWFRSLMSRRRLDHQPVTSNQFYRAEKIEREHEIKGDPALEEDFKPLVEMARDRFPGNHAWGQYIHGGKGYGIFVTNGKKKSMFQVKSKIVVDSGRGPIAIDNDIRNLPNMKGVLKEAFGAMEKALNDPGAV